MQISKEEEDRVRETLRTQMFEEGGREGRTEGREEVAQTCKRDKEGGGGQRSHAGCSGATTIELAALPPSLSV